MVKAGLVSLFRLFRRHRKYVFPAIVLLCLFVLFTAQVKAFLIIFGLGVAATFSIIYKRIFQAPPVFELTTLTTVIISILYGPWIAAIYTMIVTITMEIAGQALDPFSVTYIFPRVVTAFVAPWLYGSGIVPSIALLGLLMSLLYNVLQQPVYWYLTDPEKRIKSLYFSSLNIPLNFLIFKFLGEPLFGILRGLA